MILSVLVAGDLTAYAQGPAADPPPLHSTSSPSPSPTQSDILETTIAQPAGSSAPPSATPSASPVSTPLRVLLHGVRGDDASPVAVPTPSLMPAFPSYDGGAPPSHAPVPSVKTPSIQDRAYDLVGGTWRCVTFDGTEFTHQFLRDDDAVSLIVETDVKVQGKMHQLTEHYRYHRLAKTWSVSLADGQFTAVAGPWTGDNWEFSGIDSEGNRSTRASMTYKSPNADSFSRTFERIDANGRREYTGEHCARVSV